MSNQAKKLFLLKRPCENLADTAELSSAVVCVENEEQARNYEFLGELDWSGLVEWSKKKTDDKDIREIIFVNPKDRVVIFLGYAAEEIELGIVCADFYEP